MLPRYGLYGGAVLASHDDSESHVRGLVSCYAANCRSNVFAYAWEDLFSAVGDCRRRHRFLIAVKRAWIPGRTWGQIVLAGVLMMIP